MADAFDSASAEIEAQRQAALAAIAANGSAGAQAIADANSQIASLRSQALSGALATAAHRGVPTAGQAELSSMIDRPYGLLAASTTQMGASAATRQAALAAASGNYFAGMKAAVPIARTTLKSKIDLLNAQKAQDSQDELSDSELRTRLMGAGEGALNDALGPVRGLHHATQSKYTDLKGTLGSLERKIAARKANAKTKGPHPVTEQMEDMARQLRSETKDARKARNATTIELERRSARPVEDYAREVGEGAGLDPDRVRGLLPIPDAKDDNRKPITRLRPVIDAAHKAGVGGKALRRITKPSGADEDSTHFEKASDQAIAAIKDGIPLATFRKDMELGMPKNLKRTKALILAIYGPAFER